MADKAMVHPVFKDHTYIFSKAFYENDVANMSILETTVTTYLQDGTIEPSVLVALYNDTKKWTDLQRMYYIPILTVLSRYVLYETVSDYNLHYRG